MKGCTAALTEIEFIPDIIDGSYENDTEDLLIKTDLIVNLENRILE